MKTINIKSFDSKEWIGGLYYKRNIIFSLLQNPYIKNNYKIQVSTYNENYDFFNVFSCDNYTVVIGKEENTFDKINNVLSYAKDGISYIYPSSSKFFYHLLGICAIQWIPDFQHNQFPEYFDDKSLKSRSEYYQSICDNSDPLILSSNDCKRDFIQFYGDKEDIYVVPFVSYLEPEIKQISAIYEKRVLEKFELTDIPYVCISNQFWKHKNHIVIFQAIKQLCLKNKELLFVFTGFPKDLRDTNYYNSLLEIMDDKNVKPHIRVLGFIDRSEQLIIMKNSEFIIQPSLFEGWGTVVEDAKVLDKKIILSDIPVHREQMNENCILFNPYSPEKLAEVINKEKNIKHHDNIEKGINDMYRRAKIYSEGFEKLLRDRERKSVL